jgi:hypothetical protein
MVGMTLEYHRGKLLNKHRFVGHFLLAKNGVGIEFHFIRPELRGRYAHAGSR